MLQNSAPPYSVSTSTDALDEQYLLTQGQREEMFICEVVTVIVAKRLDRFNVI